MCEGFIFSSQFAYAVCQEQETCNSNYREPAAQENVRSLPHHT
jgi:hypothetical protein